jgi:[acyl-carrier-protein] S-malonyltransferase
VISEATAEARPARISVGTVLGHVGEHEVRSPFQGALQHYIAVDTERVTSRQPIAWLRTG